MAKYEICMEDIINDTYGEEEIKCAITRFQRLWSAFILRDYRPGQRNDMAVDLTCVCHVLHIPVRQVINDIWAITDDPSYLLQDIRWRVNTIGGYLDYWDDSGSNGVLAYMISDWNRYPEEEVITLV